MDDTASFASILAGRGFVVLRRAVPSAWLRELDDLPPTSTRELLGRTAVRTWIARIREQPALAPWLGSDVVPWQGLLFTKTPQTNWLVPRHQDVVVPVPGGPRTAMEVPVLERLLVVRVHLDPAGPDHGPLKVVPGSHRHGRRRGRALDEGRLVPVFAEPGDVLLMRPLLVHASEKARRPNGRRVVHVLFGPPNPEA
ncbi:MAG: phytanoyl-CoA dioxygenase family protein [Myxococcota bacterium]